VVVEDEPDSREMLLELLVHLGADAQGFAGGMAALARIRELRPDVVISDLGLPGMDGYAFILALRALPAEEGGQTPAVALSGYATSKDRTLALAAGFQSHLAKPVDFDELVSVVRSVLVVP